MEDQGSSVIGSTGWSRKEIVLRPEGSVRKTSSIKTHCFPLSMIISLSILGVHVSNRRSKTYCSMSSITQ